MKICPVCKHTYPEENIFYCVFDGEKLAVHESKTDSASEDKVNMTDLQKSYVRLLLDDGYKTQITENGHIIFKREGVPYVIFLEEHDPNYFSLSRPGFWAIESEYEKSLALICINEINSKLKCAKLTISNANEVWANVELFCSPEQAIKVLDRVLGAINAGVKQFGELLRQRANDFPSLVNGD